MYAVVWTKASGYAAAFVALWGLIVFILKVLGFGELICDVRRGTWALKCAMLVHHSVITPLALIAIWQDTAIFDTYACLGCSAAAPLMNRSSVPMLAARALTPVTLGYFMGDLLLLSQWNLSKSGQVETGLMLFHHITSLLVWPGAVYFDWVARYVIIMLSYEFTGLWLTAMWMFSSAGMKKSSAYFLCGLTFTVSFVIMRMIGAIPQLIAMWNSPPWSREVEYAASPSGIHEMCWFFSGSLVFPHLLNLFWGVKVVSGFLGVLTGGSKKEKKG